MNFLSDAAHLLSQASPETSAYLMRRRNELLVENDVPISDGQRQRVCTCCGHIMIPGRGDDIQIETNKLLRSKTKAAHRKTQASTSQAQDRARARPAGITKVVTCGNCSKQTRLKLEGPNQISRSKKIAQHTQQAPPPVPDQPAKLSSNASSKKRAKNRKAGLQALLDQKQSAAPSVGFGLSLSDFMKK